MSRLFGDMRQVGHRRTPHRGRDAPLGGGLRRGVPGSTPIGCRSTLSTYAGQRYDDVHISIALANSGDVQLELIQQRCGTPSMYRDFLPRRRP